MNIDNDIQSNDITQLSSREQLSALMDGALPEDQTRFLLRRLQHDAELAASWERWRIAGEAMRGLTPARRLPADFSARVAAVLHADAHPRVAAPVRSSAWRRWGGGAALAAALALVALMVRPAPDVVPATAAAPTLAVAAPAAAAPQLPAKRPLPSPLPVPLVDAPQLVAAVAAVAAKPQRREKTRPATRIAAALAPDLVATAAPAPEALPALPAGEITTRPWPRSVLPQYAGSSGLTVGFGEHRPHAAAGNPFVSSVFDAPPRLSADVASPASAPAPDDGTQPQP